MFKYVWIIMLGCAYLLWAVLSIKNLVACFKDNYIFFISEGHGTWAAVIETTLDELETYATSFFLVTFLFILGASLGSFILYVKGV